MNPPVTCPSVLLPVARSRRHDGSPLLRALRTSDGRHVPAGLLAHGSSAPASLPGLRATGPVAFVAGARRLQLREQPRTWGITPPHRVPFSPAPAGMASAETVTISMEHIVHRRSMRCRPIASSVAGVPQRTMSTALFRPPVAASIRPESSCRFIVIRSRHCVHPCRDPGSASVQIVPGKLSRTSSRVQCRPGRDGPV